jgi:hypothetical protein
MACTEPSAGSVAFSSRRPALTSCGRARLHRNRERQPEDLDDDAAVGPVSAPAPPAFVVEGRAAAPAAHGPSVDHDHRGRCAPPLPRSDKAGDPGHRPPPDPARSPAPPLLPGRLPGRVCRREVAPLAARAGEEQDRLDHLPARVAGGPSLTSSRVERSSTSAHSACPSRSSTAWAGCCRRAMSGSMARTGQSERRSSFTGS